MQYKTIEDTVYFWFGANNTSGSGADGATPAWSVRLAGAAADAAAVDTGVPVRLEHTDFNDGSYECEIAATAANGFAAGNTYAVFVTLLVDSQNPTGFAGDFTLAPVISDMTHIHGSALTETAGQLAAAFVKFFNVAAPTATALSLPDAAPNAAGGIPISADGGLDMDKLMEYNEVDETFDYSVSPARKIYYLKGTTTILLQQQLYKDKAATVPVTAVTDTIIRSVNV